MASQDSPLEARRRVSPDVWALWYTTVWLLASVGVLSVFGVLALLLL